MSLPKIIQVTGRAVPVPGDDIDTDRIIPARFMKCVTFDGLGEYLFYDSRFNEDGTEKTHNLNNPRFANASILISGANFGCGSSREHAPQSLRRAGFQAIVAGNFAEIFFGNCVALGLPCMQAAPADVEKLMGALEADPTLEVECDIDAQQVRFGGDQIAAAVPAGARQQFLDGSWDALGQLLDDPSVIGATAARLPYINGF